MRRAHVVVNGEVAGELDELEVGYEFTYDPAFLAKRDAQPVSLTLPLRTEPYISGHLHPFFAGLLAEGTLAAIQCQTLRIDERDYFGRLLATCRDTIGAVTIRSIEDGP